MFNLSKSIIMKKAIILICALVVINISANSLAQSNSNSLNLNKVISNTKAAAAKDRRENKARESRFSAEKNKQQKRLNNMVAQRKQQENISAKLDVEFANNEEAINKLSLELEKELGDLKELFGVIQQTASDARQNYKTSIISAQYPERVGMLQQLVAKMGDTTQLISINEIEDIWVELQREMVQQGKIVKFTSPVSTFIENQESENGEITPVYETKDELITRVGVFNAVSGKDIALYDDEKGLRFLDRQMRGPFIAKSEALQNASDGLEPFYIDPTKGGLLSAFVKKPSILEKVQEGKIVGYIIIGLGVLAVLIAIFKILMLRVVEGKVNKQAKNIKEPNKSNPLGRLLLVFKENPQSDSESLELKLSEAVLKETPSLNSWLMLVKIIAVVAPLLGLLGTVTGMIQTFQAITLYGAGDPQLMAGGISQALVTTVLGLVVAIPAVLLHSSAAGAARRIETTLDGFVSRLVAHKIDAQN